MASLPPRSRSRGFPASGHSSSEGRRQGAALSRSWKLPGDRPRPLEARAPPTSKGRTALPPTGLLGARAAGGGAPLPLPGAPLHPHPRKFLRGGGRRGRPHGRPGEGGRGAGKLSRKDGASTAGVTTTVPPRGCSDGSCGGGREALTTSLCKHALSRLGKTTSFLTDIHVKGTNLRCEA